MMEEGTSRGTYGGNFDAIYEKKIDADATAPPLPHLTATGGTWNVYTGRDEDFDDDNNEIGGWEDQPAIAVRAITRAEADRIDAARAAAWDAAAARAPPTIAITGATGDESHIVNSIFDLVPEKRAPGGAPVYKRRRKVQGAAGEKWLFFSCDSRWSVDDGVKARWAFGVARTAASLAHGTLPHEAPAGGWQVDESDDKFGAPQPAVIVRGVTKAEADRLEAEAEAARAAA